MHRLLTQVHPATVNINTAQNATVVYAGFGPSYTYPTSAYQQHLVDLKQKFGLSQTKVKDLSQGNGGPAAIPNQSNGPGFLYFTIHGERGAKIDITTSATESSSGAVISIIDWWEYTDNGTVWNMMSSGLTPNMTITNAGTSTLGSAPGTDGYIGVRFDATVTAVASGTATITGTVSISNYSI